MAANSQNTERDIDATNNSEDLVGVAGIGVLGAGRDDDDRERTAERLERTTRANGKQPSPDPDSAPTSESLPEVVSGQNGDAHSAGGLSRRATLAALASVGLVGAGSQPVLAAQDGDPLEFGGNYEGTPSSGYCLRLREQSSTGSTDALRALADSSDGKAVTGIAKASSGLTYGVNGYVYSEDGVGVRGKATSSSGNTFGVLGVVESPDGIALQGTNNAESGDAIGLQGVTDSTSGVALQGRARADSGQTTGALGRTTSRDDDAVGVKGEAIRGVGATYGVEGTTDSSDSGAVGVHGEATAGTGATTGVRGAVQSSSGDATGVHGKATDGNGVTYGVRGISKSSDTDAAGVKGEAPNGAHGIYGEATSGTADAGVYGEATSGTTYGVFGRNTASSGTAATGVYGETDSSDAAAITGNNTAGGVGVESDGDLYVTGHVDVDNVGVEAELTGDQTINSGPATKVNFESPEVDHFKGFNNNKYTVQEGGDYNVSFTIDWLDTFGNGDVITYELRINGNADEGIYAETTSGTSGQKTCRNFSRTLFDLSNGDDIEVFVTQDSGNPKDIDSNYERTYLTIHKVG